MLSFVNNIRITTPDDPEPRPLSRQETETILPLFRRRTKSHFDFEEIAKKLAGKGRYACQGDRSEAPYRFNFARTATVTGCPVTASLIALFGDDYLTKICDLYTLGAGKTREQILGDVWHALFSFDDEERLSAWAKQKLRLSDDEAGRFAAIRLLQDYAALSLHAINKILPYLREGYRYDEAVFVANLKAVLPPDIYSDESERSAIEADIAALITDFRRNPLNRGTTKEQCVRDYLRNCRGIDEKRLGRLYHPSMIEIYQTAQPDAQGILQLGSPRTPAVRNPMAMRALFRLRVLVNRLLRDGKIDRETKIHIEFARGLNDANRRKAIELYQRDREAERKAYADEIRRQYASESGREIEPTDDDILKYRLWKEQNHICPYTGKQIGLSDFMGDSARFDIEHTVPRARGGDNSQMNKTLCESRFNRELKRDKLPSELPNHADVMARIDELGWSKEIASLQKQIEMQRRKSKSATTKSEKDGAIQRRHVLQMQLDYWRGKYERFTMTEVPDGFSNRQGVDIGMIGKYATLSEDGLRANPYGQRGHYGRIPPDVGIAGGICPERAREPHASLPRRDRHRLHRPQRIRPLGAVRGRRRALQTGRRSETPLRKAVADFYRRPRGRRRQASRRASYARQYAQAESQAAAHPGQDTDRQERRDALCAGRYGPGSLASADLLRSHRASRRGKIRRAQTVGAASAVRRG